MVKRMLIDATHAEETRVVVLNGSRLEEFDVETSTKRQLKGNIYLAKIVRVEPSLQAAFVDYGGGRHGFLAFNEIHPDYYQIPVADRQALLAEHRAALRASGAAASADFDDVETDDGRKLESASALTSETAEAQPSGSESEIAPGESETSPEGSEPHEDGSAEDEADRSFDEPPGDNENEAGSEFNAETEPEAKHGFAPELAADGGETAPPLESDVETGEASRESERGEDGDGGEDVPQSAAASAPPIEIVAPTETTDAGGGDEVEVEEVERRHRRPLRHYKIQEVIKRRQIVLVQVVKEERGTKGAALTTYLSLAGRYCVLMPNTARGGGVSRKITSAADRKRLKTIVNELEIPDGMAVIIRTAGSERTKPEIKRDYEYLMRLWDNVRELTLQSTAPAMVYEEANLIKRSIRDLYARDIDEILVEGDEGYRLAKDFMRMLTPSHAKKVQLYKDPAIPMLHRFQVETQLDAMHSPSVQLKSGGYIVLNQTEALVAIDVNSGRATRERHIEETALKTNLEAADEIARQLRLRDLAGLIVIDFIDMEEGRNNHAVERRLKDAMRLDRARIQLGRISPFGLLELSRQRLRPSLMESSFQPCSHCGGTGSVRSVESSAVHILRVIEEEGIRRRGGEIRITVHTQIALYLLNQKRAALADIENRYAMHVLVAGDESLVPPTHRLERLKSEIVPEVAVRPVHVEAGLIEQEPGIETETIEETEDAAQDIDHLHDEGRPDGDGASHSPEESEGGRRRRRRRRRGRRDGGGHAPDQLHQTVAAQDRLDRQERDESRGRPQTQQPAYPSGDAESGSRRRRRGKRGGRRRNRGRDGNRPQQGLGSDNGVPIDHPFDDSDPRADARAEHQLDEPLESDRGDEHEPHQPTPDVHRDDHARQFPEHASGGDAGRASSPDRNKPADVARPSETERTVPRSEPAPEESAGPPRRGWWNRVL